MKKLKYTDLEFITAVKNSNSYAEVLRTLGLKVAGSNYDTIKQKIKDLNLDISHMTGLEWNVGLKFVPKKSRPLSEILIENSNWTNTNHLKERLLREGLKDKKCECCGATEWLNRPISLELHHINGIKNDLRIENLLILCPNCHAFTDNYRGKSIGKSAQIEKSEVEVG